MNNRAVDNVAVQHDDGLTWAPAHEIAERIVAREISPVEVVEHFLRRIEALDPKLHAFRNVDSEGALQQARRAADALVQGTIAGPLHGVPIAVKESLQVTGIPYFAFTTQALWRGPARRDQILVERLRAAGAIIIGTTVLPGMGTDPKTPDLSLHARNPWDLGRVPGVSSAGSATAVAAGLVPISIGSDGGGSTRIPAAFTGIIGYHATVGRVPWFDAEEPGYSLHYSCGPLARNARDAAQVMQIIAGPDGRDFFAIQTPKPDYLSSLDEGVKGCRFAWTDDFGFGSIYALPETPRVISSVRTAAQQFERLGAVVETTREAWEDYWPNYMAYTAAYGPQNQIEATGATCTSETLQAAHDSHGRNFARFQRVFAHYDLLLSPTMQFTAPQLQWWDNAFKDPSALPHARTAPTVCSNTNLCNILGWPAISVPCGFIDGLPIGLQIIGQPHQEPLIMRAAHAFLQASPRMEHPQIPMSRT